MASHPPAALSVPALRVATDRGWWWLDQADCAEQVGERADWLRAAGVRPGQVVLCPTHPAADFALMSLALPALEAALLPVAPGQDRTALVQQTGAEWVWVPAPVPIPTGTRRPGRLLATDQGPALTHDPDPLALLVQTSGSSGPPKVAMLTRSALLASASRINARLGFTNADAWLCCLPRQHIGGLAVGYRCALAGARWVLLPGWDTALVRATLAAGDISHLSLVPPLLARLLDLDPTPPPGLRVVLLGGQALDPALAQRAMAAGWPLYVGYGMTETGSQIAGAWVRPPATDDGPRPGIWPALRLLPDVEVADAGPCDPPTSAGLAAVQPLRIRAPMLMAGYGNPQRHRGEGLRDGWFPTADLVCSAPGGCLQVLGRADDLLVIGGVKVSPTAVEGALSPAPDIGEVAVLGLPEPVWGVRLWVGYTGTAQPSALAAWARAHLPAAWRPRAWQRIGVLPRLPSGKPDRAALRSLAAGPGPASGDRLEASVPAAAAGTGGD